MTMILKSLDLQNYHITIILAESPFYSPKSHMFRG